MIPGTREQSSGGRPHGRHLRGRSLGVRNYLRRIPLEMVMPEFDCCADRHASNNMRQEELVRPLLDPLLVVTPVPDDATDPPTPCGVSHHVIDECSQGATVYCVLHPGDGRLDALSTVERYTATALYPHHRSHPERGWPKHPRGVWRNRTEPTETTGEPRNCQLPRTGARIRRLSGYPPPHKTSCESPQ